MVLVVILALAVALGLFIFAHLGTIALIVGAIVVLVIIAAAVSVLVDGLSALTGSRATVSPPPAHRSTFHLPYNRLRELAMAGSRPTRSECLAAEREGRRAHLLGRGDAAQTLLIARALWSARRAKRDRFSLFG